VAIDAQIAALMSAAGTVLGGFGMWLNQRRSGKLTMSGHQLNYINAQQEDIADLKKDNDRLRADFIDLWDWTIKSMQIAAANNVTLPPLPRQRPRSEHSAADERKEHHN
jgi:hypothetical protein